MLRLVAAVERESEHPLAKAIVKAAKERGVERLRAERFESVGRHGAFATVDGRRVLVGNRRLLEREHASEAVAALKELGIRPVMLIGDHRQTAEQIAAELVIEEVLAEVLPADKAAK